MIDTSHASKKSLDLSVIKSERASLVAQLVKNPPAMQETPVRFLGWENPIGEGISYPLQYSCASWWLSW